MAKKPIPSSEEPLPFSPEEMKAIGEIELGPSRHEKFLNAHYKKLIVALLIVMAVAIACIVYGTWRARQESDSAATLISALKATTAGGAAESTGYELATLENIEANYPGTSAAATAELLRGIQLVAAGQQQQGISVLENLISTTADPFLRVRAQAYLAGRYMSNGDTRKATELWQAITRSGQSPYLAFAYLSLGDLANDAGDTELARSFYNKLQAECPASPLVFTVQQRLLLLGVDAPEPVEPAPAPAPAQDSLPTWDSMKFPTGLTQ